MHTLNPPKQWRRLFCTLLCLLSLHIGRAGNTVNTSPSRNSALTIREWSLSASADATAKQIQITKNSYSAEWASTETTTGSSQLHNRTVRAIAQAPILDWSSSLRHADATTAEADNEFFKSADEFAATFDRNGAVDETLRQAAFDLYNQQKWAELETLFKTSNWNGGWPPANGGYNIIDDVPLTAGMKFDRYSAAIGNYTGQGIPTLGGSFTSPMLNGKSYSFGQRALNQAENAYDFYNEIEVLKDLPFKGQTADIIPWFGQVGNGKQTMWKIPIDPATGYPKTWNKLAEEGYIKITIKACPSGKYPQIAGTIIP